MEHYGCNQDQPKARNVVVQPGPEQSMQCGNLFLFGATNTLDSTQYLQKPSMRTDAF